MFFWEEVVFFGKEVVFFFGRRRCQHETPINTLLSCPHLFHLSQSCRAHLIILPTHSLWLKLSPHAKQARSHIHFSHGSGAWF